MSTFAPGLSSAVVTWLTCALDDPGPFSLEFLSGGNSNETLLLTSPQRRLVLRRPPDPPLAPNAHSMIREHRIISALWSAGLRVPEPVALCTDTNVAPEPFLLMELVDGYTLTDRLPSTYPPGPRTLRAIGEGMIDVLADLRRFDWLAAGLADFGRPHGFLERQVPRWRAQYERSKVRDLPLFNTLADWLHENRPARFQPGVLHSDFRVDNCLFSPRTPVAVAAVIDWEMATIGDPMLDLGLFLAFWGTERPGPLALPHLQGVSRLPGAPSRTELADRYARLTGSDVSDLPYYMALALWKLGAIIESAYAHHVAGRLDSDYARNLEYDVPRLFAEAAGHVGVTVP